MSKALASGEVADVLAAGGLKQPRRSCLADELPEEAGPLLKRRLNVQLTVRSKGNLVPTRSFAELPED